jgi:anaerobic selenocysteine-containing dehydrogenase
MTTPSNNNPWQINRRDFLKLVGGSAAGITLGAYLGDTLIRKITPDYPVEGPGIETWMSSICRQCPAACGLRVRLVDGNVKKLDGNPLCPIARGTLCPKGQAAIQALYDPDRLLCPVRRVGPRGANKWARISWEDALADIRSHLGGMRTQNKPQALAWIAERDDATTGQLIRRFMRSYGSPNLFEFTDIRDEAARAAAYFCQGVKELPAYDFEKTTYVLSFGTPVLEAWLSPTWMARQFGHLRRGQPERRGRFIQVESRLSPTAVKADEWIPINPGTESALALSIAHVLIREDLYDRAFVSDHTAGFEDWTDASGREHVGFRTVLLRDYAPLDTAAVTGVPATTILRLAREISANRPALVVGEQIPLSGGIPLAWSVLALNALNGMIDRPGGVLTQRPLPLKAFDEPILDAVAQRGLSQPLKPVPFGFPADGAVLPALAEVIASLKPYPVEALFISSSRFFSIAPQEKKFFEAAENIPFIVSFSSTLDDSAALADLILPDHSPLEKWQDAAPLPVNGTPVWALSPPALAPLLDTRLMSEVIISLGRDQGGTVAAAFPWQTAHDVLRFVAEGLFESRRGSPYTTPYEDAWTQQLETGGWWIPSAKTFDEFWDQLVKTGGWWDPIYSYEQWRRVLRTASGKFEFVSQALAVAHPTQPSENAWMPRFVPVPLAGDPREFPLLLKVFTVLTTGGLENPNQSFLQEALSPLVYARWDSWVEMDSETARRFGIAKEDWVWLESPLGKIMIRARVSPRGMKNVLSVLLGQEHQGGGEYVKKASTGVSDLIAYRTDATGFGSMALAATTRVRISKATGGG